jgi:hypothetical protein
MPVHGARSLLRHSQTNGPISDADAASRPRTIGAAYGDPYQQTCRSRRDQQFVLDLVSLLPMPSVLLIVLAVQPLAKRHHASNDPAGSSAID